jgi:hypothetical protein
MARKMHEQLRDEPEIDYALCQGLDVYVPSFAYVSTHASLPANALKNETITIPTKLFKFLMSAWLHREAFNENEYRAANPDVDAAVGLGELKSAKLHYVTNGYFEGRTPGRYIVDENWYRSKYPDIGLGERKGLVANPTTHYNLTGRFEGRVGNDRQLCIKRLWDEALGVK